MMQPSEAEQLGDIGCLAGDKESRSRQSSLSSQTLLPVESSGLGMTKNLLLPVRRGFTILSLSKKKEPPAGK
jgi:hypothetical protein